MNLHDFEAFISLDWGYNAPGCALWWICLLDGHYHIADELKFQHQTVEEVATAMQAKTRDLGMGVLRYVVADPACWQHTGAGRGEAIAETLLRRGLPMRKGDNDRRNGWQRVHELLRLAPDGLPWLTVEAAPRCPYLRRSIPAAQSDPADPDDVNTRGDDHALDALRYGAMSRPHPTRSYAVKPPFAPDHLGRLFEQARSGSQPGVLGARNVGW